MVGAWWFCCCQAHRGLPVGFQSLRYSVLCTVVSLFLLYLLLISWFICVWRWCIAKLGVFHANQTSMCWSTSKLMVRLAPWNCFKTSSKICLLTIPRRYFYCGYLCFCGVVFSCFRICIMLLCGHLLGKCWPLGSCWWCLLYFCYFPMWYPVSGVVLDCIVS